MVDEFNKEELQKTLIDEQINYQKEIVHIRILKSFGVITIIIAMSITIIQELFMTAQSWALYLMGLFLFLAGLIWQEKSKKRMSLLEEKINKFENKEIESYRISSNK